MTEVIQPYALPSGNIEVRSPDSTTIYELTSPETVIGRRLDNNVVLQDPQVSKYHAKLVYQDRRWQIIDLGSVNGTWLNGTQLSANTSYPVNNGDIIDICGFSILVSLNNAEASQTKAVENQPDKCRYKVSIEHGATRLIHGLSSTVTTIGYKPDNDIILDDPSVSLHHAKFEFNELDLVIIDLNSGSGTYVNRSKLQPNTPRILQPGDIAEIGQYKISLIMNDSIPGTTALIQKKLALGPQTSLTIGRSALSDLVLPYPSVSRQHARLYWDETAAGHMIDDLQSTNGTFVNGRLISTSVLLRAGDIVQIGPISLQYESGYIQAIDRSKDIEVCTEGLNQFIGKGRNLLQDVSFTVKPREFVAIVGTSGAGKSTLLNALSGFKPANRGKVYINGEDLYANFNAYRDQIGFVPQSNIIHFELTVYEALYYAACLRLPSDTSDAERNLRIDEVLDTLEIAHCKTQPVRSLSGGEQKRVSMAVELLTQPGLFFLDEATSGLDPGTETGIMSLLRGLADKGHTVIIVTHATKNIVMCHKVIFMSKGGYLSFCGTPQQALQYFQVTDFDEIYTILKNSSPRESAEKFSRSEFSETRSGGEQDVTPGIAEYNRINNQSPGSTSKRVSSLGQLGILTRRNISILRRDGRNLLLMLLISPFIGMLFFLFWRWGLFDPLTGNARFVITNLFQTAIVCCLVGALLSMREIVKEAEIYKRERVVVLKIMPYIISKLWIAALISLYSSIVFIIFLELSGGWPPLSQIAPVFFTLFLGVFSGCAMGLFISSLSTNQNITPLLLVLFLVPQLIFGGVIPVTQTGPVGEALGHATTTKWTFESLVKVSGMGDEIAADPYWNLPESQRAAMPEDEKILKCKYMGPNLFLNCHFPGVLKYRVDELSLPEPERPGFPDRTFAKPDDPPSPPLVPKQPDVGGWQMEIKTWTDVDMKNWSNKVKDYEKQMEDYKAEFSKYRDITVKEWQKTYEKWKEKRSTAIGEAEGTIKAIYDDYKQAFKATVTINWMVLSSMVLLFLGLAALMLRLRDRG
jgi:ABC-type multidrug transport system ATPase subunit/pSer/pThr/pTyr-binding forkhead associated (FHA) protein